MTKTTETAQYLEMVIRKLEVEGNDPYTLFTDTEARFFPTDDLIKIQLKIRKTSGQLSRSA